MRNDLSMQEVRTWSSDVFSRRTRSWRIKMRRNKDGKAVALGPGGLADGLYQTSLLRSIASYILFAGGNDQGQQKYKSENIDKENTGYLRYNCLRTDIHSPGEGRPPQTTTLTPVMPWLQRWNSFANSTPGQGERMMVPFVLSWGLWESLGLVWLSTEEEPVRATLMEWNGMAH